MSDKLYMDERGLCSGEFVNPALPEPVPLCSHCRFPLPKHGGGLRYFGFTTAHQENECLRLLHAEIERLTAKLERERLRLAACGVVALANTRESAVEARKMHDDYRSASCDDVAGAVDREMDWRERAEAAEADARRYRWLREQHTYDGSGDSDIARWFVQAGREPVPCDPGALDYEIDAAIDAAQKEKP